MRILLVTLDYPPPPGGIQTVVRNLERGLEIMGHDPEIVHIDTGSYDYGMLDLLPTRRWAYTLKSILRGEHVYFNVVHRAVERAIQTVNPDVVHALHIRDWPALTTAADHEIPSVLTTHALELQNTELTRQAVHDTDAVTAVSNFTNSLLYESVPAVASETPRYIIPPSIDVSEYRRTPARDATCENGPVVTIARMVDRKNIETVVRAWDQIDTSVANERELIVVGEGPNRDHLERVAEDIDNIRFTGWIDEINKRDLLSKADAFVLIPHRSGYDVEGFGIVYIEAQAASTPIVCSQHGGVPEAVGGSGIIIDDEDDPIEVARAIETVLTDDRVRAECLRAIKERIEKFDIPTVTQQYLKVYDAVMEEC